MSMYDYLFQLKTQSEHKKLKLNIKAQSYHTSSKRTSKAESVH